MSERKKGEKSFQIEIDIDCKICGIFTWRYLSWSAAGESPMISDASRKAREAFCSPSAAMTWWKGISLDDQKIKINEKNFCHAFGEKEKKTFNVQNKNEKLPTIFLFHD